MDELKQDYREKLKDPRWQKKRLEILNRDNFKCQECDDTETTLNVHHIAYHNEPWDAPNELLITLCEVCHNCEQLHLKSAQSSLIKHMKQSGCMAKDFEQLAYEYYLKSKI